MYNFLIQTGLFSIIFWELHFKLSQSVVSSTVCAGIVSILFFVSNRIKQIRKVISKPMYYFLTGLPLLAYLFMRQILIGEFSYIHAIIYLIFALLFSQTQRKCEKLKEESTTSR